MPTLRAEGGRRNENASAPSTCLLERVATGSFFTAVEKAPSVFPPSVHFCVSSLGPRCGEKIYLRSLVATSTLANIESNILHCVVVRLPQNGPLTRSHTSPSRQIETLNTGYPTLLVLLSTVLYYVLLGPTCSLARICTSPLKLLQYLPGPCHLTVKGLVGSSKFRLNPLREVLQTVNSPCAPRLPI